MKKKNVTAASLSNNSKTTVKRVSTIVVISTDKLINAFKSAEKAIIENKLNEGDISKSEADKYKLQIDLGNYPIGRFDVIGPNGSKRGVINMHLNLNEFFVVNEK